MTLLTKLRSILEKPMHVVVFRARQEVSISWARITRGYQRNEQAAVAYWHPDGDHLSQLISAQPVLLSPTAIAADRALWRSNSDVEQACLAIAEEINGNGYPIFGMRVPITNVMNWHVDWLTGYTWPRQFFKTYNHYADPHTARDIKLPWELNRLSFLVPLAAAAYVGRRPDLVRQLEAILEDWHLANPYAYSVNWYPMEASMRTLNLAVLLDLARAMVRDGLADRRLVAKLATLLDLHGQFVAHTLEYTDVRGNHYAANLAALAVAGRALADHCVHAAAWLEFARKSLSNEVALQFLADGVNIEKSLPYHRLVVELFVVAAKAVYADNDLPPIVHDRLTRAGTFIATSCRPDGLLPNWGDNDDARALQFDLASNRAPESLLYLMALPTLSDPKFGDAAKLTALFLNGSMPSAALIAKPLAIFPDGGFAVARASTSYLFVDGGEVGLQGRGGHGHNDLTSFELVMDGHPIFIDPGCPAYTRDPIARNTYRSSAAHNLMTLNGREIAALSGLWQIADTAKPLPITGLQTNEFVEINVGHSGYAPTLSDYRRRFRLSVDGARLEIIDSFSTEVTVGATWHFHLAAEATIQSQHNDTVTILNGSTQVTLTCPEGAEISVTSSEVSPGFGVREPAMLIRISETMIGQLERKFIVQQRQLV